MNKKKIVVISGPTASGKTGLSIKLAKKFNGVVINADSVQVYKGLPNLSAQPTIEEKEDIEHRLFSYFEPNENCNVGLWLELVKKEIDNTLELGKLPIVVGGTGMYISKLINGINTIPYTPEELRKEVTNLYNEIGYDEFKKMCLDIDKQHVEQLNPNDKQRLMRIFEVYKLTGKTLRYFQNQENILLYPKEMFYHININPEKSILYERCNLRFKLMVEELNVLNEIENFVKNNENIIYNFGKYSINDTIGLKEGIKYLNEEINLDEFITQSTQETRRYAKRQFTWFNHQFERFDCVVKEISKENFDKVMLNWL